MKDCVLGKDLTKNKESLENREVGEIQIGVFRKTVVSVCIQTYQQAPYINECLESVLMQETNFPFEILLRDDASTDGTQEICKDYAKRYPNIINLLIYSENQYVKGVKPFPDNLKRAKGKYIAFCEGDDYWSDPLKLQKQVDFLEENEEYGLVHTEFDSFYEDDQYLMKSTHKKRGNLVLTENCSVKYWNNLGYNPTIKSLTVCFRSDLLKEYFKTVGSKLNDWLVGDFPLFFFYSLKSKIRYFPNSTAVYRTVKSGTASNLGKDYKKIISLRKSFLDIKYFYYNRYNLDSKLYKAGLFKELNTIVNYSLISGNKDEVVNNVIKAKDFGLTLSRVRYPFLNDHFGNINRFQYVYAIFQIRYLPYIRRSLNSGFFIDFLKRKIFHK